MTWFVNYIVVDGENNRFGIVLWDNISAVHGAISSQRERFRFGRWMSANLVRPKRSRGCGERENKTCTAWSGRGHRGTRGREAGRRRIPLSPGHFLPGAANFTRSERLPWAPESLQTAAVSRPRRPPPPHFHLHEFQPAKGGHNAISPVIVDLKRFLRCLLTFVTQFNWRINNHFEKIGNLYQQRNDYFKHNSSRVANKITFL